VGPVDASTRRRVGLLPLLVTVLLLDLVGLGWGLPHTQAPQVDDAAKPALEAMQSLYLGPTKYPKGHLGLLGAAYSPYLLTLWARGELDLGAAGLAVADASALADPAGTLTVLLLIARGVSVLMHLGSVLLLVRVADRCTRHRVPALAAGALYGLAPVVALFARSSHVDVPMAVWFLAVILAWLRVLERPTRGRLMLLGLLAALAVCTKEQIVFALAPLVVCVPWQVLARRASRRGAALRDLVLAAAPMLLLYALLSDLAWNPGQWGARIAWWRADLDFFREHIASGGSSAALARDALVAYAQFGGPVLALASLVALASLALGEVRRGLPWLAWTLLYPALAVPWLGFVQARYMLPSVVLGCVFVACRFDVLRERLAARPVLRRAAAAAAGLALVAALLHGMQVAWALTDEPRRTAQVFLAEHVAPGTAVETYQDENHLPGLRAVGLAPVLTRDLSRAGVGARRPAVVVVSDDERWRYDAGERDALQWLLDGPPGYELHRFGPSAGCRLPLYVDPASRARIWPEIGVLIAADG
jgi:hypothetical protein